MAHPLLRPRWVAAHLILTVLVAAFVSLGLWQLRRLEQVDARNARISARLSQPPGSIETASDVAGGDHRRARLTGTYDTANETILLQRSHRGVAGHHILTPLRTPGGSVLVDRGWVPLAEYDPPVDIAAPPGGTVTVEGIFLLPPPRGRFGPVDLTDEPRSFRIEPDKIEARTGYPLAPLYVLLEEQSPPQPGEYPVPVQPERLDRGPHLSYALQWFAFALAASATYVAFAVRRLRTGPARPEDLVPG